MCPTQLASGERPEHVEQADQANRDCTRAGIQTLIDHKRGQMQRDERGMKPTDKVSPKNQMKRGMPECLTNRLQHRLLRTCVRAGCAAQKPSQRQGHGQRERQYPVGTGPV